VQRRAADAFHRCLQRDDCSDCFQVHDRSSALADRLCPVLAGVGVSLLLAALLAWALFSGSTL
jgi:hypothetical protein